MNLTVGGSGSTTGTGLQFSSSALSFAYEIGQAVPPSQSESVTSPTGQYSFTATPLAGTFLVVSLQGSGNTPGSFTVSVNAQGLAAGTYNGSISVTSGASSTPQTIPVTLVVSSTSLIQLSQSGVTLKRAAGLDDAGVEATNPGEHSADNQTISIAATASSAGNWLTVTAVPQTLITTLNISANPGRSGASGDLYRNRDTHRHQSHERGEQSAYYPGHSRRGGGHRDGHGRSLRLAGFTYLRANACRRSSGDSSALRYRTGGSHVLGRRVPSIRTKLADRQPIQLHASGKSDGVRERLDSYAGKLLGIDCHFQRRLEQLANHSSHIDGGLVTHRRQPGCQSDDSQSDQLRRRGQSCTAQNIQGFVIEWNRSPIHRLGYHQQPACANGCTVTPTSGTKRTGNVSVTVNPVGIPAGTYSGTVTITVSGAAGSPINLPISLTITAPTGPTVVAVENAASGVPTSLSPGLNVTIFGTNMGPASLTILQVGASGNIATSLSGTQVTFDGIPAPIVYTSSSQVSVMVPYEVAGRTSTSMIVSYNGVNSTPLSVNVVSAAPGIYTINQSGTGRSHTAFNQNGTVNGPQNPEVAGDVIQIFMTGEGQSFCPAEWTEPLLPGRLPAYRHARRSRWGHARRRARTEREYHVCRGSSDSDFRSHAGKRPDTARRRDWRDSDRRVGGRREQPGERDRQPTIVIPTRASLPTPWPARHLTSATRLRLYG